MKKQKPRIIEDKKLRGEWAESVFMARAGEHGLPVSKPWGDMNSYDCVVGSPGKFAAVQVKCTISELSSGGYKCSVCSHNKPYEEGAFDFLAAYVVMEDAWYIVPAAEIRGMKSISLSTPGGKYEPYREAWHLLREAAAVSEEAKVSSGDTQAEAAPAMRPAASFPRNALERVEAAMNFARSQLERGTVRPDKTDEGS